MPRKKQNSRNNEMCKNKDFLHNLCEIAFAHQCKILSKFCAIFTQNGRKFLRNYCTIFVLKFGIGNQN